MTFPRANRPALMPTLSFSCLPAAPTDIAKFGKLISFQEIIDLYCLPAAPTDVAKLVVSL